MISQTAVLIVFIGALLCFAAPPERTSSGPEPHKIVDKGKQAMTVQRVSPPVLSDQSGDKGATATLKMQYEAIPRQSTDDSDYGSPYQAHAPSIEVEDMLEGSTKKIRLTDEVQYDHSTPPAKRQRTSENASSRTIQQREAQRKHRAVLRTERKEYLQHIESEYANLLGVEMPVRKGPGRPRIKDNASKEKEAEREYYRMMKNKYKDIKAGNASPSDFPDLRLRENFGRQCSHSRGGKCVKSRLKQDGASEKVMRRRLKSRIWAANNYGKKKQERQKRLGEMEQSLSFNVEVVGPSTYVDRVQQPRMSMNGRIDRTRIRDLNEVPTESEDSNID